MSLYIVEEILHYCHIKPCGCSKMGTQTIDYYDLTFVLEGSMVYIINGKRYTLKANDAIFLPPQTLRERERGDEFVEYVSFNFRVFGQNKLNFDAFITSCISVNIRRLLSIYRETHISAMPNSREKCECILNYILFELSDVVLESSQNIHVTRMIEYINANKTGKITLDDISNYTNLSKEYCSYLFKRETQKTLIYYINEKKISAAKSLMANGEMSLSDISYYLGYDNYNYFSRLFKKHVGIRPTVFLKEWK